MGGRESVFVKIKQETQKDKAGNPNNHYLFFLWYMIFIYKQQLYKGNCFCDVFKFGTCPTGVGVVVTPVSKSILLFFVCCFFPECDELPN